ncbi:MAG: class I SAM-dependent methyltransferase [Pseudomonadota bacterium]|nr:class I SAM-dependent methyltransferase [Pseudomonadota bacterium]
MATDARSKYSKARRGAFGPFVAWLNSQVAAPFCEFETDVLGHEARRFHGDVMLWLGPSEKIARASSKRCMVRARFYGSIHSGQDDVSDGLVVAAHRLPFPSNSIDGLVLHHVLEFGTDARAVLREAQRVLQPGGRLVICGFNSLSFWGLLRWRSRFRGLTPLSSVRIQDWISVLGIHRDQPVRYFNCHGRLSLSINDSNFRRIAERMWRIPFPFGDVYVICGTKQRTIFVPTPTRGFSRLPKADSIGLAGPVVRL